MLNNSYISCTINDIYWYGFSYYILTLSCLAAANIYKPYHWQDIKIWEYQLKLSKVGSKPIMKILFLIKCQLYFSLHSNRIICTWAFFFVIITNLRVNLIFFGVSFFLADWFCFFLHEKSGLLFVWIFCHLLYFPLDALHWHYSGSFPTFFHSPISPKKMIEFAALPLKTPPITLIE